MQNLSISFLRSFVSTVMCGTFEAGGKLIGRSKSAISQHISKLEEELGVELFVKDGRKMKLTSQGIDLFVTANQILMLHDKAVKQLSNKLNKEM